MVRYPSTFILLFLLFFTVTTNSCREERKASSLLSYLYNRPNEITLVEKTDVSDKSDAVQNVSPENLSKDAQLVTEEKKEVKSSGSQNTYVAVCRNRGGNYYFSDGLSGDYWGTPVKTPGSISFGNEDLITGVALWRSSYDSIAPRYDSYGHPLYTSCMNCPAVANYCALAEIGTYIDKGLYRYETGRMTNAQARVYFSDNYIVSKCGFDDGLSYLLEGLLDAFNYSKIPLIQRTAYNLLDHVNFMRYGCPDPERVEICFGR